MLGSVASVTVAITVPVVAMTVTLVAMTVPMVAVAATVAVSSVAPLVVRYNDERRGRAGRA